MRWGAASRVRVTAPVSVVLAVLLLSLAAPARGSSVVAHGHSPDAVTDRDGTTHLVWSEYRAQRSTDTSNFASRVDIVHYCKILRGSATCTGEQTFMDCVLPDDQLPTSSGTRVGLDSWGPHVMISPFGDVVITSTRYCRYAFKNDQPDSFHERVETHAWLSEDDGDSFAAQGWVGNMPAGANSPGNSINSDPVQMLPSRPLFDAADRRIVMPYSAVGADVVSQGAWLEADPIPPVPVPAPEPVVGNMPSETRAVQLSPGVTSGMNVAQRGRNSFAAAWTEITTVGGFNKYQVKVRTFDCADCPLAAFADEANWSPPQTIDDAVNARVVSGPSGTFVTYQHAPPPSAVAPSARVSTRAR